MNKKIKKIESYPYITTKKLFSKFLEFVFFLFDQSYWYKIILILNSFFFPWNSIQLKYFFYKLGANGVNLFHWSGFILPSSVSLQNGFKIPFLKTSTPTLSHILSNSLNFRNQSSSSKGTLHFSRQAPHYVVCTLYLFWYKRQLKA